MSHEAVQLKDRALVLQAVWLHAEMLGQETVGPQQTIRSCNCPALTTGLVHKVENKLPADAVKSDQGTRSLR